MQNLNKDESIFVNSLLPQKSTPITKCGIRTSYIAVPVVLNFFNMRVSETSRTSIFEFHEQLSRTCPCFSWHLVSGWSFQFIDKKTFLNRDRLTTAAFLPAKTFAFSNSLSIWPVNMSASFRQPPQSGYQRKLLTSANHWEHYSASLLTYISWRFISRRPFISEQVEWTITVTT